MAAPILTLNAGSSSIKFALFEAAASPRRVADGEIEDIESAPHLRVSDASGTALAEKNLHGRTYEDFTGELLAWAESHLGGGTLAAVGHRIVHGGPGFVGPVRLGVDAVAALERLSPLAPLHQPHNLNAIKMIARLRPDLPQIGCFDTAFHNTMSATARRFALPRALEVEGIHRYGFHGLSYEFISGRLKEIDPEKAAGRIIVAHLGSGASLCALKGGQSMDTTMGLTPLDGLAMGTRCGALDPGVVLYLMQQCGMDAKALEDMLYHRSGLLGVSGISADMRVLLASTVPAAREAVDLFVVRVVREIGALAATLRGLDGIVFTAGIGENSAEIRQRVCEQAEWLGISIDIAANEANAELISTPQSPISVWVIPTDEELMIARHVMALLA